MLNITSTESASFLNVLLSAFEKDKGLTGLKDSAEAFKKIAAAQAMLLYCGDASGTNYPGAGNIWAAAAFLSWIIL
jgi:ABC-type tungstate transport system permease subunit